jgi:hypothetical protein
MHKPSDEGEGNNILCILGSFLLWVPIHILCTITDEHLYFFMFYILK